MKSKIILSCIAAAIVVTFLSCELFGSKKKADVFDITGQWNIDSIANNGSDSSNNIGLMALALAGSGDQQLAIQFNADSSFRYVHSQDSTGGTYYLSKDQNSLFIEEDSLVTQLNFLSKSDTAFTAVTPDSVVYFLKRK